MPSARERVSPVMFYILLLLLLLFSYDAKDTTIPLYSECVEECSSSTAAASTTTAAAGAGPPGQAFPQRARASAANWLCVRVCSHIVFGLLTTIISVRLQPQRCSGDQWLPKPTETGNNLVVTVRRVPREMFFEISNLTAPRARCLSLLISLCNWGGRGEGSALPLYFFHCTIRPSVLCYYDEKETFYNHLITNPIIANRLNTIRHTNKIYVCTITRPH